MQPRERTREHGESRAGDPGRSLEVEQAGLLAERGDRVALTEAGFLVSDALFVELL